MPFNNRYLLERHFVRHGEEFGSKTADEYEKQAELFMTGLLREGVLECYRRNGARVRFDPATDNFGIVTPGGNLLTFMKATPLPSDRHTAKQYYELNCRR